jgi:DTW domain-containing protein YfiP
MMPPRTRSIDRCARCRIFLPLCLCGDIAPLILDTRVVLYMHRRERWRATNTGWLACLALPNSEIRLRGAREQEPRPPLTNALLLFPSQDAVELTPEWLARQPRPVTLVLPDGSWNQAKKAPSRESGLAGIPNVKLPAGAPSCYRLRRSPRAQNLSTLEAIARALGVIEGREVQVALEGLFLKMVERRLWSMGRLRPEECVTVIPEEAILASRRAGAAGGKGGPMTGGERLVVDNPAKLVTFLRERKEGQRKLRLFGCACCRRVWGRPPVAGGRQAVEVASGTP